MARRTSEAWGQLFNPGSVIPFLVGSLAMAVLGNAVFMLLTNWLGSDQTGVWFIIATTAVFLTASVLSLRFFLFRAVFEPTELVHPRKRRGLVVLVSTRDIAEKAIHFHSETLQFCWLVCSETSQKIAEELRAKLPTHCQATIVVLANDELLSPIETYRRLHAILTSLPDELREDDVICDLTGMNKLATVGMALACSARSVPMEYVPVARNKNLDPAGQLLDPIEIIIRLRLPIGNRQSKTLPSKLAER